MNSTTPMHVLMIGGPAHGQALWVKAGTHVDWSGEHFSIHRYAIETYVITDTVAMREVFFKVALCEAPAPSDDEMRSIEGLIAKCALKAHPASRQ